MKLVFLGTPEFAVPSLARLHEAGHQILAVVTQPDRPAGRGRQLRSCAVKREAEARDLPVRQPARLDPAAIAGISELFPEVAVVVAYGLILPPTLLALPTRGCINLHASLLPRYRGAAPIAHAILHGEVSTGVTTLQMDQGIDTGPLLLQRESAIGEEETAGEVEQRLATLGADLLVKTLSDLENGKLVPRPQLVDRTTYAKKISPEQARIRWDKPAAEIVRLVRAMNPRPGASTCLGKRRVKIWRARVGPAAPMGSNLAPGTLLGGDGPPRVQCGGGTTGFLMELQMEGRRRVLGEEAMRGRWFGEGDRFDEEPSTPGSRTRSSKALL